MFELDKRLENDCIVLGNLELCKVLLMNDSQYPWVILVPRRNKVSEIFELSVSDRELLNKESNQVLELLNQEFNADKMNVAALGNVVKQLHIHHIVRYTTDKAWPAPVWGIYPALPYSEDEIRVVSNKIRRLLVTIGSFQEK